MSILEQAQAIQEEIVANRRTIHKNPELGLDLPKTVAFVKEKLIEEEADIYMIENCGMEEEKVYTSAGQIPDNTSYYSLIIMKDRMKSE